MKIVEETILIKGVALFSALTGLQQWLIMKIDPFDIFFILLIVLFLLSVERDYFSYKKRTNIEIEQTPSIRNSFFLTTA